MLDRGSNTFEGKKGKKTLLEEKVMIYSKEDDQER